MSVIQFPVKKTFTMNVDLLKEHEIQYMLESLAFHYYEQLENDDQQAVDQILKNCSVAK